MDVCGAQRMIVALALIIVPGCVEARSVGEAGDIKAHVSGAGKAPHNGIACE